MLAYAAHRRPVAKPHPKTLLLIVAGHAAALFAVMTARGDLPGVVDFSPIKLIDFTPPEPPPPPPPPPQTHPTTKQETVSKIDQTDPVIRVTTPNDVGPLDPGPSTPNSGNGNATVPTADPVPTPLPLPILVAARSLTSAGDLIPPYPDDKLRLGEEASIQLRLAIDPSGRVTAVSPLGTADASFLAAARRHILRRWHYQPATKGGMPIASSQVVTIRFRLDG